MCEQCARCARLAWIVHACKMRANAAAGMIVASMHVVCLHCGWHDCCMRQVGTDIATRVRARVRVYL